MNCFDNIKQWMDEIRLYTEMECTCILQGASIPTNSRLSDCNNSAPARQKSNLSTVLSKSRLFRTKCEAIRSGFAKLYGKVENDRWTGIGQTTILFESHVSSLITETNSWLAFPPTIKYEVNQLTLACVKLLENLNRPINGKKPAKEPIYDLMSEIGQSFTHIYEFVLMFLIKKVVESIDKSSSIKTVQECLNLLLSIAEEGDNAQMILIQCGVLKKMLSMCQSDSYSLVVEDILKVVTALCLQPQGVIEVNKMDGMNTFANLLTLNNSCETVQKEAAACIAQILSPPFHKEVKNGSHLPDISSSKINALLQCLTDMLSLTDSSEVFLMACSAIANVCHMYELDCDNLLHEIGTVRILVEGIFIKQHDSIFIMDQVATILACMSSHRLVREDLLEYNGFELLRDFLYTSPNGFTTKGELAACERVQQKVALTIYKLSRWDDMIPVLTDLEVIPRLIELCRNGDERARSNAVLMAVLSALRGIHQRSPQLFAEDECDQLIKPKLIDSILKCSTVQESFV